MTSPAEQCPAIGALYRIGLTKPLGETPGGNGDACHTRRMTEHTYRVIEVVGTSTEGTDAAIANAIARVSQTTRNVDWFEVVGTRGHVTDGAIAHTQVTLKVGFRIDPE